MTVTRRVVVAGGVLAGLAGAYFAGAALNRPARAEPDRAAATVPPPAPELPAEINGVKVPQALPPARPDAAAGAVQQPTDVLTGIKPVPESVLRAPPPAQPPEFVIPDLSAKK